MKAPPSVWVDKFDKEFSPRSSQEWIFPTECALFQRTSAAKLSDPDLQARILNPTSSFKDSAVFY